MIAFPGMLLEPARQAGMATPSAPRWDGEDLESIKDEFPHFYVFCRLQLGRSMSSWNEHWENAEVIADIPEDELKQMDPMDFIRRGVQLPIPDDGDESNTHSG